MPFLIPELTPDSRPWRIDWFGELAYPAKSERFRQPSIQVAISPLQDPEQGFHFWSEIQTVIEEQQTVWIPIGALPKVRIGDVWQAGVCKNKYGYAQHVFANLEIDGSTATYIKAGVSVGNSFLLPFSDHPWHRAHTHAYCLMVAAGEVCLVIPCVELIRFYFGSSSQLVRHLCTKPLAEWPLWQSSHFNPDTGHLHLKLADRLSGASAADIGRIALSDIAQKAAAEIYEHCAQQRTLDQPVYPRMPFPFRGRTTLAATGMWLPWNGNPKSTFLAFHLDSCSHPFPYRSLSYDAADRAVPRHRLSKQEAFEQFKAATAKVTAQQLGAQDGGTQQSPGRIPFDDRVRFTDLRHKDVWRERIVALASGGVCLKRKGEVIEIVDLGTAEDATGPRSVDLVQESEAPRLAMEAFKPPRWLSDGAYMAMCQLPLPHYDLRREFLLADGRVEPIFQLPLMVDEDGVIDEQQLYVEPDGQQRTRRACFVGFFRKGKRVGLFGVVEGRGLSLPPKVVAIESVDVLLLLELLNAG